MKTYYIVCEENKYYPMYMCDCGVYIGSYPDIKDADTFSTLDEANAFRKRCYKEFGNKYDYYILKITEERIY